MVDNQPSYVGYTVLIHWREESKLNKWDKRFYNLAKEISTWSKDPSTKVGAVIVNSNKRILCTGYNGMPTDVNDVPAKRWVRPEKYFWVEHAERNAIYQAARYGISIEGSTIYTTTFPCADCTRAIIQSGIKCIITPYYNDNAQWFDNWKVAEQMLLEANIDITAITWWA